MKCYKGQKAADGIAIGNIKQLKSSRLVAEKRSIQDADGEKERFQKAAEQVQEEQQRLYETAGEKLGEEEAAVVQGMTMLAGDMELRRAVEQMIEEEEVNAEYALHCVIDRYVKVLSDAEDLYIRERSTDLKEVKERILSVLLSKTREYVDIHEKSIIVSEELSPEQMIRLDRNQILAFVMAGGSVRSHAAIMARIMGIPAVVSAGRRILELTDGTRAAVDGYTGEVYAEPDEGVCSRLEEKNYREQVRREKLKELIGRDTVTQSGKRVTVCANISSGEELGQVEANDGAGVGLFRSEWLYLERSTYPSEEMQVIAYGKVLARMGDKRVVIRTMDVGGDKKADYMKIRPEDNPVLGLRGIRVCFEFPDVFRTQLRALYRASVQGNLAIMFPMITSIWEVRKIKTFVTEVQEELRREGIPFRDVELGIMIETPAAAMISEELADEVDFFSIGTNDLTQYTLAADRQNPQMEAYYDSTHTAVMKLIELAVCNAGKKGIPVSVCGELGADLSVTQQLLDMGITMFSVSPSKILQVKEKILSCR